MRRRGLINHQSSVFLFDPDTGRRWRWWRQSSDARCGRRRQAID
jgi:hypothetical protein